MALFRLPSSGPAALIPRGQGLLLRAPQMSDFPQWAQLREHSRAYLTPWEPIWPSDDLSRAGFRRRGFSYWLRALHPAAKLAPLLRVSCPTGGLPFPKGIPRCLSHIRNHVPSKILHHSTWGVSVFSHGQAHPRVSINGHLLQYCA